MSSAVSFNNKFFIFTQTTTILLQSAEPYLIPNAWPPNGAKMPMELFVEKTLRDLGEKLGLKNIDLIWSPQGGDASALGSHILPFKKAMVFHPNYALRQPNPTINGMVESVCGHELTHIKNNDLLKVGLVRGIISCCLAAAFFHKFPTFSFFSSCTISAWGRKFVSFPYFSVQGISLFYAIRMLAIVTMAPLSVQCEKNADQTAYSIISEEGIRGAVALFKAMQKVNINAGIAKDSPLWARLINKLFVTEDGEFLLDILHPSLKSRIHDAEEALRKKIASRPNAIEQKAETLE